MAKVEMSAGIKRQADESIQALSAVRREVEELTKAYERLNREVRTRREFYEELSAEQPPSRQREQRRHQERLERARQAMERAESAAEEMRAKLEDARRRSDAVGAASRAVQGISGTGEIFDLIRKIKIAEKEAVAYREVSTTALSELRRAEEESGMPSHEFRARGAYRREIERIGKMWQRAAGAEEAKKSLTSQLEAAYAEEIVRRMPEEFRLRQAGFPEELVERIITITPGSKIEQAVRKQVYERRMALMEAQEDLFAREWMEKQRQADEERERIRREGLGKPSRRAARIGAALSAFSESMAAVVLPSMEEAAKGQAEETARLSERQRASETLRRLRQKWYPGLGAAIGEFARTVGAGIEMPERTEEVDDAEIHRESIREERLTDIIEKRMKARTDEGKAAVGAISTMRQLNDAHERHSKILDKNIDAYKKVNDQIDIMERYQSTLFKGRFLEGSPQDVSYRALLEKRKEIGDKILAASDVLQDLERRAPLIQGASIFGAGAGALLGGIGFGGIGGAIGGAMGTGASVVGAILSELRARSLGGGGDGGGGGIMAALGGAISGPGPVLSIVTAAFASIGSMIRHLMIETRNYESAIERRAVMTGRLLGTDVRSLGASAIRGRAGTIFTAAQMIEAQHAYAALTGRQANMTSIATLAMAAGTEPESIVRQLGDLEVRSGRMVDLGAVSYLAYARMAGNVPRSARSIEEIAAMRRGVLARYGIGAESRLYQSASDDVEFRRLLEGQVGSSAGDIADIATGFGAGGALGGMIGYGVAGALGLAGWPLLLTVGASALAMGGTMATLPLRERGRERMMLRELDAIGRGGIAKDMLPSGARYPAFISAVQRAAAADTHRFGPSAIEQLLGQVSGVSSDMRFVGVDPQSMLQVSIAGEMVAALSERFGGKFAGRFTDEMRLLAVGRMARDPRMVERFRKTLGLDITKPAELFAAASAGSLLANVPGAQRRIARSMMEFVGGDEQTMAMLLTAEGQNAFDALMEARGIGRVARGMMDTRPLRGKVKADAEAVLTGIREGIGMRDLGEMNIAQRFDTEQAKIALAKAINESEIPNEIKQGWRTLAESVRMTLAEFLNSDVTGYGGQ